MNRLLFPLVFIVCVVAVVLMYATGYASFNGSTRWVGIVSWFGGASFVLVLLAVRPARRG